MKIFEGKTPKERRNLIIIMVAAPLAFLGIIYNLGFFSSKKPTTRAKSTATSTNSNRATTTTSVIEPQDIRDLEALQPVRYSPAVFRTDLALGRNIFSYYVPPPRPTGTPAQVIVEATPEIIPTPVPPSVILASLSPSSVFARTKDFQLLASGDKFTPDTRIYLNNQELPTQYVSPQQLKTNIPASLIAAAGTRAVMVRTPDNILFSNQTSLNVMPPPVPQYTYVGLVGARNPRTGDTAVLKPQAEGNRNNDLLSVQRGDTIGGRFILNNISANALELTDKELGIKHTLPFTESRTSGSSGYNQQQTINNRMQSQQRPASTDDEGEFEEEEDEEEEPPKKP